MSLRSIMKGINAGYVKVAPSGKEFFGTVVKNGNNDKTVVVKVTTQYWNNKARDYYTSGSKFQVHDEENFCVVGDKVVISQTHKFTPTKYYYIRNVVKAFSRDDYYEKKGSELDAKMQVEYDKLKKDFIKTEIQRSPVRNRKHLVEIRKTARARAQARINQNLKKMEADKQQ